MKITAPIAALAGFLIAGSAGLNAQPVEQLIAAYSGKAAWNASSSTLEFTRSGAIEFTNAGVQSFIWKVPPEVKQVRLARDVTVNGAFHCGSAVCIAGADRKTSVVYGAEERSWPQHHGVKAFTICSFQSLGGVMTISNLTSLNPRAFHVRGAKWPVHVAACDFIDTRGGLGNHSDGVEGGNGSTVDDCYFESGDDIIKVYADITVNNTTIKMIDNAVPIQLGWSAHTNRAVGSFHNLVVLGDSGRISDGNAVIVGRKGRYDTIVNIDGCRVENTNGTLVCLREDSMTLRGAITNARIQLKAYAGKYQAGTNLLAICGSDAKQASYDCGASAASSR